MTFLLLVFFLFVAAGSANAEDFIVTTDTVPGKRCEIVGNEPVSVRWDVPLLMPGLAARLHLSLPYSANAGLGLTHVEHRGKHIFIVTPAKCE